MAAQPCPDAGNDPAADLTHALALVGDQDWRAAGALFARAKDAYQAAGKPRSAAGAAIGQANCLSETGDLLAAREILQAVAESLAPDDPLLTTARANLAVCLARGGNLDEAERLWHDCFTRYLDAGHPGDAAACLHNAALALHERGRHRDALRAVSAARSVLAQTGDMPQELVAACDNTAGLTLLALGEFTAARQAHEEALSRFLAAGRTRDAGRCHGNLAIAALEEGDLPAAREHSRQAARRLAGDRSPVNQVALLALSTALALADGDAAEALRLSQSAAEIAGKTGNVTDEADALHNVAVALERQGDHSGALRHALAAFDIVDDYRYGLASLRDRHIITVSRFEALLLHALDLAATAGTDSDVAELVERARVAGTPRGSADSRKVLGSFDAMPLPDLNGSGPFSTDLLLPLEPRQPVTLSNRSSGTGKALHLPDIIHAAGGGMAWWWGTWLQRGHLYWAVRDPGGQLNSGRREIAARTLDLAHSLVPVPTRTEIDQARALAETPQQARLWARLMATARLASGPMAPDPQTAESADRALPRPLRGAGSSVAHLSLEEAMSDLGTAVLPAPLIETAAGAPVRLVVSLAPGLSWLPLPLLIAPISGSVRYLADAATVSFLPPLPLAGRLAAGPAARQPRRGPRMVDVSVVDPSGDLRWARRRVVAARHCLGNPEGGGQAPATTENVRRALETVDPEGLFVYQGHIDVADPGEPLSASMVLQGKGASREYLSAYQLLTEPKPWRFPADVVLDGCESLGAWGSAEWGGLVPALLSRGAERVTSTLWPLLDTPSAATMTSEIISAVTGPGDPAERLANVQRAKLAAWQAGDREVWPHHFGAHVITGITREH